MQEELIMRSVPMLVCCLLLTPLTSVQQQGKPCDSTMKYESRNQVDPPQLSVKAISGRVIDEVGELGESVKEIGPVDGACLGLFTETGHQLKATAVADKDGRFKFGTVPSGNYRLVVRADGLCVANVPLRVARGKRKEDNKLKEIVVHMRAAGIDTCSYADYK